MQAPLGIELDQLLHVFGVDSPVVAGGLPGVAGVIPVFLFLDPDHGLRKKIDAADVVPMGVADDDVGDLFGLDARKLYGLIRAKVFRGRKILEKSVAMIAAVKKD